MKLYIEIHQDGSHMKNIINKCQLHHKNWATVLIIGEYQMAKTIQPHGNFQSPDKMSLIITIL